jgi:hypothetical protein
MSALFHDGSFSRCFRSLTFHPADMVVTATTETAIWITVRPNRGRAWPRSFPLSGTRKWAGFVLVREIPPCDTAEVFVKRKYRRVGIGREAAARYLRPGSVP